MRNAVPRDEKILANAPVNKSPAPCIDTPTSGRVLVKGEDVSQKTSDELADLRARAIGFVFQTFNLLPRATALHNVELPLVYGGVTGKLRQQRAREALGKVELNLFSDSLR